MPTARLRILETTDLHMHLLGFDYLGLRDSEVLGLANLAPLIAEARDEAETTLLFDNGDLLQGTPLAEHVVRRFDPATPHPALEALSALGCDAITLGNHEFDYGLEYLQQVMAQARMPVVCANLRIGPEKTLYPPWVLLERDLPCSDGQSRRLRIGVIGFVTPQIVDWGAHRLQGAVRTDDILDAARTYLPQLARAGADLTVALCHSGISALPATPRMENAALPLAALPGIDVVLCGHTHDQFPGPGFEGVDGVDAEAGTLHGTPTVMAGAYGAALGVVDLELHHNDAAGWRIAAHRSTLRHPPEGRAGPAPALPGGGAALNRLQQETLDRLREPIATTPRRLTSYLAALGRDDTADLVAQALARHVLPRLAETGYGDTPLLVATAPFRAGGHRGAGNYIDLAPGPVTRADASAIAPFNNPVCALFLRGWQVRAWLEGSSALFAPPQDGPGPQPLLNFNHPIYHFDTLHGLRYRIDLSVPPGLPGPSGGTARVQDITLDGAPLEDDQPLVVVTSAYRAYGGGGLISAPADAVLYTSPDGLADILARDLGAHGIPDAAPPPVWDFAAAPGRAVTFRAAPAAWDAAQRAGLAERLTPGAVAPSGFQDFTLSLDLP